MGGKDKVCVCVFVCVCLCVVRTSRCGDVCVCLWGRLCVETSVCGDFSLWGTRVCLCGDICVGTPVYVQLCGDVSMC